VPCYCFKSFIKVKIKKDLNTRSANTLNVSTFEIMKFLKSVFSVFWKIWFLLYFVVTLIILFPLFFILLSSEKLFPFCFKLMRLWGWILVFGGGFYVHVKQRNKLPRKPYIICANHVSYLDIILCYCIIPDYFVFMGKQELSKVPLFNIFFKRMNILVNRKSAIGSHKALMQAAEELDKGHCLAIFPEGTISKEAPKLRPFKNGPFRLAIQKQVDIVPVTFISNYKLLQDAPFFKGRCRPGIAGIVIHPAIQTMGMTENDLVSLRERVSNLFEQTLNKYADRSEYR